MGGAGHRLRAGLPDQPQAAGRGHQQAVGAAAALGRERLADLRVQADQLHGVIHVLRALARAVGIRRADHLPAVDVLGRHPGADGLDAGGVGHLEQLPPVLRLVRDGVDSAGDIRSGKRVERPEVKHAGEHRRLRQQIGLLRNLIGARLKVALHGSSRALRLRIVALLPVNARANGAVGRSDSLVGVVVVAIHGAFQPAGEGHHRAVHRVTADSALAEQRAERCAGPRHRKQLVLTAGENQDERRSLVGDRIGTVRDPRIDFGKRLPRLIDAVEDQPPLRIQRQQLLVSVRIPIHKAALRVVARRGDGRLLVGRVAVDTGQVNPLPVGEDNQGGHVGGGNPPVLPPGDGSADLAGHALANLPDLFAVIAKNLGLQQPQMREHDARLKVGFRLGHRAPDVCAHLRSGVHLVDAAGILARGQLQRIGDMQLGSVALPAALGRITGQLGDALRRKAVPQGDGRRRVVPVFAGPQVDIIEEGEVLRIARGLHRAPGVGDRGIRVSGVFTDGGTHAIGRGQRRAGLVRRKQAIGFREARDGGIRIGLSIEAAKRHRARRGGGVVHGKPDVAVGGHPVYRHGVIAVQHDELRFTVAVHIVRIGAAPASIQHSRMPLDPKRRSVQPPVRIDDLRLAEQKQQHLRRQALFLPLLHNGNQCVRKLLGDLALPVAGQLIQLHNRLLRAALLQIDHRIAQQHAGRSILIIAQRAEAVPRSLVRTGGEAVRRTAVVEAGPDKEEHHGGGNQAQGDHHGDSLAHRALMAFPDLLSLRLRLGALRLEAALFLCSSVLAILFRRFRFKAQPQRGHPLVLGAIADVAIEPLERPAAFGAFRAHILLHIPYLR